MPKLESARRFMCHWLGSISVLALLGLTAGGLISIPVIPKPSIATITISGVVLEQAQVSDVLDLLRYAGGEKSIKGVVLQIDSPGGQASLVEQIYLDVLRLRQQKPVVTSIGAMGASGGYYIAVASNFIYAHPTSQLGSIGAWSNLPRPEELGEDVIATGPFKATGGSRRKATSELETLRQEFVTAVITQRGDRLKLSPEELSQAEIFTGAESLRYGLIDEIGTITAAIEKAASLAGVRHYSVIKLDISEPPISLSSMEDIKSRTGMMPVYYYLYFESR